MKQIHVLIMMGSDSDAPVMQGASDVLNELGISNDMTVASAHRSPGRVRRLLEEAPKRGVQVFIVGAGAAAHLGGVVAAHTIRPVIGVPIDATSLHGLDALLSTVQMPPGVPVATVAIGKTGATNAGVLAAQMLALADVELAKKLIDYKKRLAEKVDQAAARLETRREAGGGRREEKAGEGTREATTENVPRTTNVRRTTDDGRRTTKG